MTLKFKLVVGTILLSGAGVVAISQFSYRLIERASKKDLEAKASFLARNFTSRHLEAIERKDEAGLLQGLLDLIKDQSVAYAMVFDMDGRVIAHTDILQAGRVAGDLAEEARRAGQGVTISQAMEQGQPVLVATAKAESKEKDQGAEAFFLDQADSEGPSGQERSIGAVRVGLFLQPVLDFTNRIRKGMLFIGACTLALVFVFSAGFAVFLTRPLNQLMRGIADIRGGNLTSSVDISSSDELGQVGQAFNQMTQDLHRALSELEGKVCALAKANKELRATQEKVVRSERLAAIGQLASGVGHELRNPLAAIRNAIYYVKDALGGTAVAEQDPSVPEFLDLADKEIQSATRIINDLLDFARIPQLVLEPTDIHDVILEAKKILEIPGAIVVKENFSRDLPALLVDRGRMRQVFLNMIQNAVQAMPKGGELRIETRLEGGPRDPLSRVHVDFKDTGTGISPENLCRMFEPLFTTKAKGTGLGLPISQGIVEKHGGKITVTSQLGQGSMFTVSIPAAPPAA